MIGIFDSGIGGLTALARLRILKPCSDICYLADKENAPYGEKDAETLVKLIESGTTRFFLGHLSRENNIPQLAYQTSVSALSMAGAKEGEDYYIRVAKPVWDEKAMIL